MHRLIQFLDSDHGMFLAGMLFVAAILLGLNVGAGR